MHENNAWCIQNDGVMATNTLAWNIRGFLLLNVDIQTAKR